MVLYYKTCISKSPLSRYHTKQADVSTNICLFYIEFLCRWLSLLTLYDLRLRFILFTFSFIGI